MGRGKKRSRIEKSFEEDEDDEPKGDISWLKDKKWRSISLETDHFIGDMEGGLLEVEEMEPNEVEMLTVSQDGNELVKIPLLKKDKKKKKKQKTEKEKTSELKIDESQKNQKQTKKKKKKSKKSSQKKAENEENKSTKQEEDTKMDIEEEKKLSEEGIELNEEAKNNDEVKQIEEEQKEEDGHKQEENSEEKMLASPWFKLGLHPKLSQIMEEQGFKEPTSIQKLSLTSFLRDYKDIVGASETGSGKTYAFGLPILHHILASREKGENDVENHLVGLILTPTRELAQQVAKMLKEIGKKLDIKVAECIGGISVEKQTRLLKKRPSIIVATPGRLWDLICDPKNKYLRDYSHLQFFVLDEADRMIQTGHFEEVKYILQMLPNHDKNSIKRYTDMDYINEEDQGKEAEQTTVIPKRHTFVFSATLTFDPLKKKPQTRKKQTKVQESPMERLMGMIKFERKIEVIDLSTSRVVVETLSEAKIEATDDAKDYYLYYLLELYKGKSIVFVNAITAIRRLTPILKFLRLPIVSLHANMKQGQRLKKLEQFKKNPRCVLVCTDVAARGLDIPRVDFVVHYQIARTADLYVHRSGRTARANAKGLSVMLVGPKEYALYKKICHDTQREGLSNFPIDNTFMKNISKRVDLARRIDKRAHQLEKLKSENQWWENAAKKLDVDVDFDVSDEEEQEKNRREKIRQEKEIRQLQHELDELMKQPLQAGLRSTFFTKVPPSLRESTKSLDSHLELLLGNNQFMSL